MANSANLLTYVWRYICQCSKYNNLFSHWIKEMTANPIFSLFFKITYPPPLHVGEFVSNKGLTGPDNPTSMWLLFWCGRRLSDARRCNCCDVWCVIGPGCDVRDALIVTRPESQEDCDAIIVTRELRSRWNNCRQSRRNRERRHPLFLRSAPYCRACVSRCISLEHSCI